MTSRETIVYVMATFLIGASLVGSFGIVRVREAQATSAAFAESYFESPLEASDVDETTAQTLAASGPPAEPRPAPSAAPSPPQEAHPQVEPQTNATPPTAPAPVSVPAPSSPAPVPTPMATPAPSSAPTPAPTKPAPQPDKDRDGIPDAKDRCPTRMETRNGYLDADGCPDVITTTRAS